VRFLWALGVLAVAAVVAASCYDPTIPDCILVCTTAADCPSGTACTSNGTCARPEAAASCLVIDATPSRPDAPDDRVDASPIDAPIDAPPGAPDARVDASVDAGDAGVCPARCTACTNGTCLIQCEQGMCDGRIVCPAGMPCVVVCRNGACGSDIDCSDATRCDIRCSGNNSCQGLIVCGTGRCDVACGGNNSCPALIDCSDACACEVECTGANTCRGNSSCPNSDMCSAGNGCSDMGAGCDRC
jgi:hypothetical protein